MFAKLALRNVKRQIGNYLIYFITVSLTVSFMFAVNNLVFSEELQQLADKVSGLTQALVTFTVFLSIIIAFVLSYASAFMLKLRKREFGTYLTLGMTRGNLLRIFIMETLILGAAALCTGIVLGLFVYQGIIAMVTAIMDMPSVFASYSTGGLTLTAGLVGGMFLLSSIGSARYLKRASIYKLLHGARKVEKTVRFPFLWLICAILSLYALASAIVVLYNTLEEAVLSGQDTMGKMVVCIAVVAVSIVLFHVGFSRSTVFLFLKNRDFCARGTNSFVLRQLSGKLKSNSLMLGFVAFLTAFAVITANTAFMVKTQANAYLEKNFPYDITGGVYYDVPGSEYTTATSGLSLAEGRRIIEEQVGIERELPFKVYTTGNSYIHSFTDWESNPLDSYISLSDFNRLYGYMLEKPLSLEPGSFVIAMDSRRAQRPDFEGASINLNGMDYKLGDVVYGMPMLVYSFFLAVVPDEALEGLPIMADGIAYDVKNKQYDGDKLYKALSTTITQSSEGSTYNYSYSDYRIKEYIKVSQLSSTAVVLVGLLYTGIVLLLLAMAVLALKSLTGLSEDRERYELLSRLGADEASLGRTLFRQTASFFFLPFAVPVLMCIPMGMVCTHIMELANLGEYMVQIILLACGSAVVFAAIYLLYFAATLFMARRNVLRQR